MPNLSIDPARTALVLIDLQKSITARELAPRSASEAVKNAALLLAKFRERGATVALVHVAWHDQKDRLIPLADNPLPVAPQTAESAEFVSEVTPAGTDLIITKRQWGAFHGTELDLQLRRRGVNTIVLGGIATNMGVESTARNAYELGYDQIFAEDAMTSVSAEAHEFSLKNIFPRIGRVRSTGEILQALAV